MKAAVCRAFGAPLSIEEASLREAAAPFDLTRGAHRNRIVAKPCLSRQIRFDTALLNTASAEADRFSSARHSGQNVNDPDCRFRLDIVDWLA